MLSSVYADNLFLRFPVSYGGLLLQYHFSCPVQIQKPRTLGRTGHDILTGRKRNALSSLHKTRSLFFHPDYTVGPGVTPDQPPKRVADYTASRESHPAPKNIMVINLRVHYIAPLSCCKASLAHFKHKFAFRFFRIDLLDMRADLPELLREILISSLDILDIIDLAVIVSRESCDHKGCTCAQVR